ncbi:nudix-type nucleoside diphosphatase (YffH/AdpP family) [Chitinophaga dinghuensis]|uniref:GDP-mannose pyrophosphatase n=1 Tax=Chitinophaga dinghuensis TaxID=1539050 RepID=A0A327WFB1_9BACT|nr:GDP-mannose pyrophosphatase NudK [Chitinophaga dinghuensis]RAJ88261.1 nudix-type nucleoside diphosphatase (YffH/AdpP family) [Chitinophaga dinghuensis]
MQPEVKIMSTEILSDNWYTLKKVTYEYKLRNGDWQTQSREAYDRGNGAVILLYNPITGKVILTRQFRLPSYINGNSSGMLIEACAGLLDENNPEECIRREAEEETGYRIQDVKKVFEVYMSPGSVTEMLHFFVAAYDHQMRVNDGGGLAQEQEEIEVMEVPFNQALEMVETGEIKDGKTIMLLQWVRLKGIL